jgi:cell division septation protein DedD
VYTVNVAAFKSQGMAEAYVEVLRKRGLDPFLWTADLPNQGKMYRVSIGRHGTHKQADAAAKELREKWSLKTYVTRMSKGQN